MDLDGTTLRCTPGKRNFTEFCLTDWSDEQLASMVSWGNARANEHWEARKPASISATDE